MSTPLLPDALWNLIQPLLPAVPLRPKGGRPRLPIVLVSPAFCSSFAAGYPGRCCLRNCAVVRA
jgi:hypothetical protein